MWSDVAQKIKKLKQFDQCFVVDGASLNQYIISAVDEEKLFQLEEQLNIEIPTQFRSFLLQFGAGCCGPDAGITTLDDFELYSMDLTPEYGEWLNANVKSFMRIGWGSYISEYCIITNGMHKGMIYEFEENSFFIKRADSFMAWYAEWLRIQLRCFEVIIDEIRENDDITEIMMNLYTNYKIQPALTLTRLKSLLGCKDFERHITLSLIPSFYSEQQVRKIYLPEKVGCEFKTRIAQYFNSEPDSVF